MNKLENYFFLLLLALNILNWKKVYFCFIFCIFYLQVYHWSFSPLVCFNFCCFCLCFYFFMLFIQKKNLVLFVLLCLKSQGATCKCSKRLYFFFIFFFVSFLFFVLFFIFCFFCFFFFQLFLRFGFLSEFLLIPLITIHFYILLLGYSFYLIICH